MADLPVDRRPRERLLRLGPWHLTDAELVALLLGSGHAGRNAVDLAADVLRAAGGTAGLLATSAAGVAAYHGVGPVGACRILAAAELARRATTGADAQRISSRSELAAVVVPALREPRGDELIVVVLDRRLRLTATAVLAGQTDGHAAVPAGDVVQRVVEAKGAAFAVAHAHPGGTTLPTDGDRAATRELRDVAGAHGLRFLDHLVVAGEAWAAITE